MSDVVVVGGGIIGLSIAYELAGQGASVSIFDRTRMGTESSWAGAGILPPGNPQFAQTAEARLRGHSHLLWKPLSEQLLEETGIDNGFRNCGGLTLAMNTSDPLEAEIAHWSEEQVPFQRLTAKEIQRLEPQITSHNLGGILLPQLSQVRNPRHLKAMIAACFNRGVQFHPGEEVLGFDVSQDTIESIQTRTDRVHGGAFALTSGAWSEQLLSRFQTQAGIHPVQGHIVVLNIQPLPFHHLIEVGSRYLVPRPDGHILIGSTEEHVGFNKQTNAKSIHNLLSFAFGLVPILKEARFVQSWTGLRPGSPNGIPWLSAVPNTSNLFLAAGHFRSGLQMSPITGKVMSELILGQELSFPLDEYSL